MSERALGRQFGVFHGNQGTLFNQQEHADIQRQRVVSDEARYPRGFTPGRMRGIKDVLMYHRRGGSYSSIYSELRNENEEHPFSEPRGTGERAPWMTRNAGAARIAETIARSTVPLEDLKQQRPTIMVKQHSAAPTRTAVGSYRGEGSPSRGPLIELYAESKEPYVPEEGELPESKKRKKVLRATQLRRTDAEMTLIHELGHHASNVAGTNSYKTSSERGAEEARADDYAHQHHRRDPRDVRRSSFDARYMHSYDVGGRVKPRDPYGKSDEDNAQFGTAYKAQRQVRIPGYKSPEERMAEEEAKDAGRLFTVHPWDRYAPKGDQRLVVNPNIGRQWDD